MVAATSSPPRSIRRAGSHGTEREDRVDETTALLPPSSRTDAEPDPDEDKPLPMGQILLLCYARVIEPLAFFSIFPYVSQMVQDNGGVADADVGFYSGLIESLFSLTQAIIMIFWGRAADRFGRKPVLVFSLFGVTVATGLFGLAQTIPQMILFRCLAGVFAGTIVTIRTMVAEHSTSHTQARAFSWFAFSGNLGIFLGPLLGGSLADPVRQYPGVFGSVRFFADYPYALSSLVVAMVGATAAISSALFVQETLKREPPASADREETGESAARAAISAELSTWDLLQAPGVGTVIYTYGHIMVLAFAYTAIVPVFWFTPPQLGGYGFTPRQISLLMGLNGAAQAAWLLLVFPPLQKRLGSNGVIRLCAYAYPFFFLACPAGNVLLRVGTEAAVQVFWVFVPITLVLGCGVSMSFTAIQLALNDISPSPRVLGTLNALALTGVSGLRAFNPALFTTLFALGARSQLAGGYAIWVLMVVLALGLSVAARGLPEPQEARKRDAQR
ncbi:permease of the major facilitator superfamily [Aspergillus uvarum CBS 121591]|uniref:Permease of the major facilitator superfamily n=1 Tax=Aspergillus uvarum CBS 121591 TaxID=1448315 RepID=A0A319BWE8_9EURO|nr:permease of the major facilitator superfamily [Aspergillus uvarum CBS 121591]PYH75889.1 permease of the major facilitator superfamily [Aspergillus uvarum CBS 121591]